MGTGDSGSNPARRRERLSVPGLAPDAGELEGRPRRPQAEQDARDLYAGLVAIVTGAVIMLLAGGSLQGVAAIFTVLAAVGAGILAIAR